VRIGDAWTYESEDITAAVKSAPSTLLVRADFLTKDGEVAFTNQDPDMPLDQQFVYVYSRVPTDACMVEGLTGIWMRRGADCAKALEPGATWTRESKKGETKISLAFRYMGMEKVTVPAGTFDALRIDCDNRAVSSRGEIRMQRKFWYVPALRGMARVEETRLNAGNDRTMHRVLRKFTSE